MQQAISHRVAGPYTELAAMYDATLGVPFFVGTRRAFEELVRRYGINFRSAADIGRGTGLFAGYLSRRWSIPTYAVDRSPAMLAIAMLNCTGCEVGFLQQDIRCLQLPQPVDLVTANFDTLNYLLNGPDLRQTFRRIYVNLRVGGYFIFDLITPCQPQDSYLVRMRPLPGSAFEPRQQILWDGLRRLLFTTIVLHKPGAFALISESHVERAYSPLQATRWLGTARFLIRDILDARTLRMATGCPPRIIIVAQKPHEYPARCCQTGVH
ncbi:MAG: class I SAM-dependent methyltransferase [Gammaproteobacteria bacterium]|nr:class I SAM-dependent methyltransferase [Gammaproteobacteria bacterium]